MVQITARAHRQTLGDPPHRHRRLRHLRSLICVSNSSRNSSSPRPHLPLFPLRSAESPPLNDLHSRPSNNTGPWAKARRRHHGSLGGHSHGEAKESRKWPLTAARKSWPSPLHLSNGQEVGAPCFFRQGIKESANPSVESSAPEPRFRFRG